MKKEQVKRAITQSSKLIRSKGQSKEKIVVEKQ